MVRENKLDTLGKTIAYYRKMAGLTQEQLADKIFVKRSTLSDIENDRSGLDVERLMVIANALEVHPVKFLEYKDTNFLEDKSIMYEQVIEETSKLEDMELVGMVLDFIMMLQKSSYNKKSAS